MSGDGEELCGRGRVSGLVVRGSRDGHHADVGGIIGKEKETNIILARKKIAKYPR